MLKEERLLREWWTMIEFPQENKRSYLSDIRALVRAVREDCAKAAEECVEAVDKCRMTKPDSVDQAKVATAKYIAAAIREGRRG